jgi:ariadne-1
MSEEWSSSSDSDAYQLSDQDLAPIEPDTTHIELVKVDNSAVFSSSSFQEEILKDISHIADMLSVSFSAAATLLQSYRWNREALTEAFFANPSKVLQSIPQTVPVSGQVGCLVCGEDSISQLISLECNHPFCRSCWGEHLTEKISAGHYANIPCLQAKCPSKVIDSELVRTTVHPSLFTKYIKFRVAKIAETHPLWRRCPVSGCEYVIKVDSGKQALRCRCLFSMCSKCSREAHLPATCVQIEAWDAKSRDEGETYNWLKVNTQACPKCHTSIEKNGGCNHMTCWKCTHEFCWICMGDWADHSTCNAYKAAGTELAAEALERYLHYFHRFMTHEKSSKFEVDLRQSVVEQMVYFYQNPIIGADLTILESATENLIECRKTLKHTYVYAFNMKEGSEKNLFEFLQAELEVATENLSRVLEIKRFTEFYENIRVLSNNAATRLLQLLEGVDSGLIGDLRMRALASTGLRSLMT